MARYLPNDPVPFLNLFLRGIGVLSFLFWPAAFGLILWSIDAEREARIFEDRGVRVQAEVIETTFDISDGSTVRVEYSFEGTDYGQSLPVSERTFRRLEPGGVLNLYVVPDDPLRVRTFKTPVLVDVYLMRSAGLFLGLLGAICFYIGGGRAARAVLARRFGEAVLGHIVEIEELPSRLSTLPSDKRLVWEESDGRRGRSGAYPARKLSKFQIGDQIRVYRGPKRSWWEGDLGPRDLITRQIPKVPLRQPE